jgi:ribosomal protein S3
MMSRCWKTQSITFVLHEYQAIKCKSTKELINNSTSQVEIENTKSKLQVHLTIAKS